jgi:hypothetical protein
VDRAGDLHSVCFSSPSFLLKSKKLDGVGFLPASIAFLCYLVDLQTGSTFGNNYRLLSHSHLTLTNLPLPASDALWEAESAMEWRLLVERRGASTVSFKEALNALLSRAPPTHNSTTARILSSLSRQSSFSITILYQTLLSLQSQITASQRLIRGFAGPPSSTVGAEVFGGLPVQPPQNDVLQAAATSAQESSERIVFGLKVLRMLGGTAATTGTFFSSVEPIFD